MFIKILGKTTAINFRFVNRFYVRKDETDDGITYVIVAEMYLEGDNGAYEALRIASFETREKANDEFFKLLERLNQ